MSTPSEDRPPLRIGTQEREAAYKALEAHLDAGRLDVEEYGERYAHASMARTRPELDALFVDLPEPHPFRVEPQFQQPMFSYPHFAPPPPHPGFATSRRPSVGRVLAGLLAVIPLIALVLFLLSGVWIFFLLIPIVGSIFGRARGHNGHGRGNLAGACGRRW